MLESTCRGLQLTHPEIVLKNIIPQLERYVTKPNDLINVHGFFFPLSLCTFYRYDHEVDLVKFTHTLDNLPWYFLTFLPIPSSSVSSNSSDNIISVISESVPYIIKFDYKHTCIRS